MSFDLQDLTDAVARHGRVARVVIADLRGSAPREPGAAMLVWADGQSGTIGGGALEFAAAGAARAMLAEAGAARLSRHALGPDLGQCCGGSVQLLTEVYDAAALPDAGTGTVVRRVPSGGADMPLALRRMLAGTRAHGHPLAPALIGGWMVEPLHRTAQPLWVWGAGHVGRALIGTLAPLPDFAITWVDTAPDRFPADPPANVETIAQPKPAALCAHVPANAAHLVLTYSHALDLALCDGLLRRGFASAGLIGSATKWARFRKRLAGLGHSPAQIDHISCPIGAPELGKHPQQIAIGVAAQLLESRRTLAKDQKETG